MVQLKPLFDRIVVKEHSPVAVGGGVDWWESVGFKMPVAVGDHVMWPYTAGVYIEVSEERLLVLRVGELLGVVEEVREEALAS